MNFHDLQKLRREAGLSQEELGAAVGCSQSTIHRIEKGTHEPGGALKLTITSWIQQRRAQQPEAVAR